MVIGLASSHITGSNDLLTALDLARAYENVVKPYLNLPLHTDIKGKGRAIEVENAPSPSALVKQEDAAGTAREKGKTIKKHYNHMIADVPGVYWRNIWT